MGDYRLFRNLLGQILTPERITTGYFIDVGECLFTPFNTIKKHYFFQRKKCIFVCAYFDIFHFDIFIFKIVLIVLSLHFTEINFNSYSWVLVSTPSGNMTREHE